MIPEAMILQRQDRGADPLWPALDRPIAIGVLALADLAQERAVPVRQDCCRPGIDKGGAVPDEGRHTDNGQRAGYAYALPSGGSPGDHARQLASFASAGRSIVTTAPAPFALT